MEYRVIYNGTDGIVGYTEHTTTSITKDLNNLVVVGEIEECLNTLRKKNIDYQGFIDEIGYVEPVLLTTDISDYPTDTKRRVDVVSMPILGNNASITMRIVSTLLDEETVKTITFPITNDIIVDVENNIGEFDYFYNLVIIQGGSLKDAIINKILEMDSRNIFN